jgi:hypothetical protein
MSPEDHFKRFIEIVNWRDLEALGDGLAEEAPEEQRSAISTQRSASRTKNFR